MRRHAAFALLLAAIVAGCAGVRIDVDVYKGPLSNHEDIQVRQYAALAIAARPVLAQMRNRIEDRYGKNPDFAKLGVREREHHVAGHLLTNETAHFINGAMSFYLDATPPRTAAAIDNARLNSAALRDNIAVLDNRIDEDRQLGRLLLRRYPADAKPQKFGDAESWRWLFGHQQGQLLQGVRSLNDVPSACEIRGSAFVKIHSGSERAYTRGLDTDVQCACRLLAQLEPQLQCASERSTNSTYAALESEKVARSQSQALLGRVDDRYVARMMEKAKAYRQAREAFRNVWQSTLELLDSVADTTTQAQRDAIAVMLSQSTQPRNLACSLTAAGAPRPDARIEKILASGGLYDQRSRSGAWDGNDYRRANVAVAEAAKTSPVNMIRFLRETDEWLRHAPAGAIQSCGGLNDEDKENLAAPSARRYGLARGPTFDVASGITRIEASLSAIAAGSAGFDRVRPPLGIEALTSNFLVALRAHGNDVKHRDVMNARRELEESLIQWAERISVVVRNRAMLTPQLQQDDGQQLAREVAVLEAVANTIILNADDMRRRDMHDIRQRERAAGELSAVQQAFGQSPSQIYDAILKDATGTAEALRRAAPVARPGHAGPAADELQKALDAKKDQLKKLEPDFYALASASLTLRGTSTVLRPDPGDVSVAADAQAVAKEIQAQPTTSNMATVVLAITRWLDREWHKADISLAAATPRMQRLDAAKRYLSAEARKPQLDALQASVSVPAATSLFAALHDQLDQSASASGIYVVNVQRQAQELEQALKARQDADKADAQMTTQLAGAQHVLEAFAQVRGQVLNEADRLRTLPPRGVLALLQKALEDKAAALSDGSVERKKIEQAIQVAKAMTPPQALSVRGPTLDRQATQVDVADNLLAHLRAQRTQALASNQAAAAEGLQASINYLLEQRSDMAYIRPASAYLKSVYASTSLQSDPDVGWVNMLARNTQRALGGEPKSDYDKEMLLTRTEIDKQYWQNINTVNVAGGGRVNYVLAKDDIGNWYVKAYSTDPGDIFRSAQGLALFGMGKRLDVNLLRRAQLQRQLDSTPPGAGKDDLLRQLQVETDKPSAAGSGALAGVAQRYQADYETRTRDDASSAGAQMAELGKRIREAWAANLSGKTKEAMLTALNKHVPDTGVLTQLSEAGAELQAAIDKKDGTPSERAATQGRTLIRALEAVRRLRFQLEASIRGDGDLTKPYSAAIEEHKRELERIKTEFRAIAAPTQEQKNKFDTDVGAQTVKINDAIDAEKNAGDNRSAAAKQVVTSANELISQVTRRRLDTIRQTETAFTIVGQTAGSP